MPDSITLYHQTQMRIPPIPAATALLACSFAIAGCRSLPDSKPQSQWTVEESRGAVVFNKNCARCHHPTTTRPLNGPGLQALTKIQAMPSGAPPTDERLRFVILHGRNTMPATQLTGDQLSDLMAYLHTL